MASSLPTYLDSLKCPVCLDYAENAVETKCCSQIYCEKCLKNLFCKECPTCRQPNVATVVLSKSVLRLIGELPTECPNSCGETVMRRELSGHEETCPAIERTCLIKNCQFTNTFKSLIDHTATEHAKEIFHALKEFTVAGKKEMASTSLQTDDVQECPFNASLISTANEATSTESMKNHDKQWFERVFRPKEGPIKILNSEENYASMAPNGKFYCETEDGAWTFSRDSTKAQRMVCSYDNRLNCKSCMKLDITLRNLPYGSLVNGDGHVTKPEFCNHDVKGSEYFANNSRDCLCRHTTCGTTPRFSCDMPDVDRASSPRCTILKSCTECEKITYVYDLQIKNEDINYYQHVWEKAE